MRLLIFSGFLGSGKTTLIVQLARHLAASGTTTCLVVNEVGDVGIDQSVLRGQDLNVWELTSGCICCQLGLDLVSTLQEIDELYRPDIVIVEASGVATPSGIQAALVRYGGRPFTEQRFITMVDPTRLKLLWDVMTPLVQAQIELADEIVISKAALAQSDELAYADAVVQKVKPGARPWLIDAGDVVLLQPLMTHLAQ